MFEPGSPLPRDDNPHLLITSPVCVCSTERGTHLLKYILLLAACHSVKYTVVVSVNYPSENIRIRGAKGASWQQLP